MQSDSQGYQLRSSVFNPEAIEFEPGILSLPLPEASHEKRTSPPPALRATLPSRPPPFPIPPGESSEAKPAGTDAEIKAADLSPGVMEGSHLAYRDRPNLVHQQPHPNGASLTGSTSYDGLQEKDRARLLCSLRELLSPQESRYFESGFNRFCTDSAFLDLQELKSVPSLPMDYSDPLPDNDLSPRAGQTYPADAVTTVSPRSEATVVPSAHRDPTSSTNLQHMPQLYNPYQLPVGVSYTPMPLRLSSTARSTHSSTKLPATGQTDLTMDQSVYHPITDLGSVPHHQGSNEPATPSGSQGKPTSRSFRRQSGRRLTRSRRTDQGPEPSSADIYPEDALPNMEFGNITEKNPARGMFPLLQHKRDPVYTNPMAIRATRPRARHGMRALFQYQPDLQVEDHANWPTPAEVYHEDSNYVRPTKTHIPPTQADIEGAFDDVLDLLNEIPRPSHTVLSRFGLGNIDLACHRLPLCEAQLNGSRYGMRFCGVGLGDEWVCPPAPGGVIPWA